MTPPPDAMGGVGRRRSTPKRFEPLTSGRSSEAAVRSAARPGREQLHCGPSKRLSERPADFGDRVHRPGGRVCRLLRGARTLRYQDRRSTSPHRHDGDDAASSSMRLRCGVRPLDRSRRAVVLWCVVWTTTTFWSSRWHRGPWTIHCATSWRGPSPRSDAKRAFAVRCSRRGCRSFKSRFARRSIGRTRPSRFRRSSEAPWETVAVVLGRWVDRHAGLICFRLRSQTGAELTVAHDDDIDRWTAVDDGTYGDATAEIERRGSEGP